MFFHEIYFQLFQMGAAESIPEAPPLVLPDETSEKPTIPLSKAQPVVPTAESLDTQDKTLVIHNLTKQSITYWIGEEYSILPQGETTDPLVMPVHIFPAKVAVRPTSTPRFYFEDDTMFADHVEGVNSGYGRFRSVSATVTFTVEHFHDYHKVTIKPSAAMA